MAYVKSHCTKFVFFLFCLSQVQGASLSQPAKPNNPIEEPRNMTSVTENMIKQGLIKAGAEIDSIESILQGMESYVSSKEDDMKFNANYTHIVKLKKIKDEELKSKVSEINEEFKKINANLDAWYTEKAIEYDDIFEKLMLFLFTGNITYEYMGDRYQKELIAFHSRKEEKD